MAITSTNFPNNHVLLHFRKELHKNPATFERTRNLYYVAALVSSVAAVVFFISAIALQKTILPLWKAIGGATVAVYAANACVDVVGRMIQNAQEADKAAVCLKEMQDTYRSWQAHSLSEPTKIMILYYSFATEKYIEARERLKTLTKDIAKSGSMLPPESKLKEMIQLQHQALLLKIDLSFKIAIYRAFTKGKLNCLTKKEDLLIISTQDPWERHQIQGLNELLPTTFTEPLICFKNNFDSLFESSTNLIHDYPEALSYKEVQEMSPNSLAKHMLTLMQAPITELI
jgi:hypothetical protein